jgi:hypothetical protein
VDPVAVIISADTDGHPHEAIAVGGTDISARGDE